MVEKFVDWNTNDEKSLEKCSVSWQDLQGLGWLFFEDFTLDSHDDVAKPMISLA